MIAAPCDDGGRRMPKAELHCHIEGAAPPDLVAAQAARYGIDVSGIVRDGRYVWTDFSSFLAAYDLAASTFRTEEDYAHLAEHHLAGLAAEGALYAEIFVSPDHAEGCGLGAMLYLEGLGAGLRRAEAKTGIVARMVVVGVRHFGPASVEAAARVAASASLNGLVSGFGLAGDERRFRPADFVPAFDIARDAGLGLTCHAGEFAGPDAIRETLDRLRPARLGHGIRAIEEPSLVARIAEEGIVLEVCPGSNLALGVTQDASSHPMRALKEAGVRVTVNSDDPPFFGTSLSAEYAFAGARGFSEGECIALTRTAIEAGFLGAETRGRLLDRLVLSALALGAPGASL